MLCLTAKKPGGTWAEKAAGFSGCYSCRHHLKRKSMHFSFTSWAPALGKSNTNPETKVHKIVNKCPDISKTLTLLCHNTSKKIKTSTFGSCWILFLRGRGGDAAHSVATVKRCLRQIYSHLLRVEEIFFCLFVLFFNLLDSILAGHLSLDNLIKV